MHAVTHLLITISKKWWALLLVFILNAAAFGILFSLEDQFEAITGIPVYDTQNDLTPDRLLQQLPLYTGEARSAYLRFAAFDFIFPLVAAVFIAVLWALLLRLNRWRITQQLLLWNLPLVALLVTLWDWLENVSLLMILNTGTTSGQTLVDAALLFKRLKLLFLMLNGTLTGVLVVLLVLQVTYRIVRHAVTPTTTPITTHEKEGV